MQDPATDKKMDKDLNPFANMGFFRFWFVSTLFYLTFPLSLAASYLVLGPHKTKQLVTALVHDFLQTMLIILAVVAVIIWIIYHYIAGLV